MPTKRKNLTGTKCRRIKQAKDYVFENKYNAMVNALFKNPDEILATITPHKIALLHAAVGIASEAGEILDAVKKYAIYDLPLNMRNLKEESGDLSFYHEALRQGLKLHREEAMKSNMEKLSKRYPGLKYSDRFAAIRLDKQ